MNYSYITAITNENYYKGLAVLIKSLKKVNVKYSINVMVPDSMDISLISKIQKLDIGIIKMPWISIPEVAEQENLSQNWNHTFFKLNIMRLTQFEKIIFVDADMLVLKNLDHLFNYPSISATTGGKSAHPEWNEFNSGLMIIEPNANEFEKLVSCIPSAISRKQSMGLGYGDQDVFNEYYPEWNTLPNHNIGEEYNAELSFLDALVKKHSLKSVLDVSVIHYIGFPKIWNKDFLTNLRNIHGSFHSGNKNDAIAIIKYLVAMKL